MSVLYSSCRVCGDPLEEEGADDRHGGLCVKPARDVHYRGCFERFWNWLTGNKSAEALLKDVRDGQNRNVERALQAHAIAVETAFYWSYYGRPELHETAEWQIAVETWIERGAPDCDGIRSHHLF